MASKPTFKRNTAEMFISGADDIKPATKTDTAPVPGFEVPTGYRLQREYKSERMQLLVRPTTKEIIKQRAAALGISMNDLVCQILDEYVERQEH